MLLWTARGKTYKEISAIMDVAYGSVKTYLDAARYKLNAVNATQACVLALMYGIYSYDEVALGHYEMVD